jgi:hypothetical protein
LRPVPRALRLIFLSFPAVLGWSAVAGAAPDVSATGELEVGGGHDSNVFLSSTPEGGTSFPHLGGWLFELGPAAELAIAGSDVRIELSYDGDIRRAEGTGWLSYQQLGLTLYSPEIGRWRLLLGALAGRFDPGSFPADAFWFVGGQLGARLALSDATRVIVGYRFERRQGGDESAGDQDALHLIDARLSYRPVPRLALEPRLTFLTIRPAAAGASDLWRLRGGLDVSLVWQEWTVTGGASAGPLSSAVEEATYGAAQIEVKRRLFAGVDAVASLDWTAPVSGEPVGDGLYTRFAALAGVVLHATSRPALPAAAPREDLRPLVQEGRVRFRVRAPGAASVAVLGSWDDWATPGKALSQTREPGLWELWLALPAGAHRYHFMVDGVATRPPDAARYMPDGFGGEDGVVELSEGGVVSSAATGSYVR